MLEDESFLLPREINDLNKKRFEQAPKVALLGKAAEQQEDSQEQNQDFESGNQLKNEDIVRVVQHFSFDERTRERKLDKAEVFLRLPKFDRENQRRSLKTILCMELSGQVIQKIEELLKKYPKIVCFTDGSSLYNPGSSGCGVAFYGVNRVPRGSKQGESDNHTSMIIDNRSRANENEGIPDSEELELPSDSDDDWSLEDEQTFLFGLSLHLGISSNNYAEYTGVILAQTMLQLFG
mmetsp:Transcript_6940/g.11681  ORF Transcript_6940/g.11681 Transcript_6940/m.11681 type:complete len:236 (-) Transcript_6940:265-972(-)